MNFHTFISNKLAEIEFLDISKNSWLDWLAGLITKMLE